MRGDGPIVLQPRTKAVPGNGEAERPDALRKRPRVGGQCRQLPGRHVELVGEEILEIGRRAPGEGVELTDAPDALIGEDRHAVILATELQVVMPASGKRIGKVVAHIVDFLVVLLRGEVRSAEGNA